MVPRLKLTIMAGDPLLTKNCPARLVDARDPHGAIVVTDKQS